MNTRDTAARVRGVPRCVEIRYHTRTRQTRDLKPAGFPVPVTIPSDSGLSSLYTQYYLLLWCLTSRCLSIQPAHFFKDANPVRNGDFTRSDMIV